MCKALNLKRGAYYSWTKREQSNRKREDDILSIEIKRVHQESGCTYGVRRIKAQLDKDGIRCGKNRISRLMKENNVESRLKRKFKATTYSDHNFKVAPNLLEQKFTIDEPNKVYVGDITYMGTDEGWLYLATIMDLFNREIVGWSIDSTMTRKLVIDAFNTAINKENPEQGLIFHSDRGVQYASYDYQDLIRENGFIQSMSAKGCCYDNACAESFFSSLKKDRIYGRKFKTRLEAKSIIVEYIELFYNSRRLHSKLSYNSPREYKRNYYKSNKSAA